MSNNQTTVNLKELQQSIRLELSAFVGEGEAVAMTRMLLEHFTGYDTLFVNLNPQTSVSHPVIGKIKSAIAQLIQHKPIQYVLGEATFCGLRFEVNENVLIPRPETEELTWWVLEHHPNAATLLDLCSGSGCIAVTLAHYCKESRVYAVDLSEQTLVVLQRNAALHRVAVETIRADVLDSGVADLFEMQFDVIVANPPYVLEREKALIHRRVLDFEPSLALFVADGNPLLFYRAILAFGQKRLAPNAMLYVEINEAFGREIVSLFEQYGYSDVCLRQDIQGKNRMVCGRQQRRFCR
jgi:release factor glutamine methyltransferase